VVSYGVSGRALKVLLGELKMQLKINMWYCVNRGVLSHISGEMVKNDGASCDGDRPVSVSISRTLPLLDCLQLKPDFLPEPIKL